MRIEELYLDGFGHFHQRTIGPVGRPVTVFYGPNEAGKSTLLSFIRVVLFGFPPRFNSHYPPLAGGRHGGRIALSDDGGVSYGVDRYAGARGGLSIASADGPMSNVDAVMRRLTGNATPDLFRNIFAFSLDELQAAASLNDSNGTIYSAGQGAPGLPELTRALDDHKGRIFRPRGSSQEVPRLLNALRDVDSQLRLIEANAGKYGLLIARKAAIDSDLPSAEAEIASLNLRRTEIDRLLGGWQDWVELCECESRLRDLPSYENFPENPIARLDSLEAQIEQASEAVGEAAEQLRRAEEAASAEILGENLLFDRPNIEIIRRSRQSFDDSVKDLPERRAELDALESELGGRLRELGQDWDEDRLQEFNVSMAFRQEVDTSRETQSQRREDLRRAEQRMEQEQRLLEESQAAAQEARGRVPDDPPLLDAEGLDRQRTALRAARGRLGEYERARQNHENLRGQLNSLRAGQQATEDSARNSPVLAGLLAVAGVLLIVGGVLLAGAAMVVVLIGGLVLLAAAGYLVARGRMAPASQPNPLVQSLSSQAAEAEAIAEASRQRLAEASSPLGTAQDIEGASLDSAEVRLDSAQAALASWNEVTEKAHDTQRRVRSQEQRVESAALILKDAEAYNEEARRNWQAWLAGRSLPASFTPETVIDFMGRVEAARVKLEQVRDNRRRVSAIEDDISMFRAQMEPLAERHGLAVAKDDDRQLASASDELIQRLDEVQASFIERERAREQLEENRQLLENRERRLQSATQVLDVLLAAAGTDDAEVFRRRARQHEERQELERNESEHRRSLERLSGPGERLEAFREQLANSDTNLLGDESAALLARLAEVEESRNTLREERGGIDAELAQLAGEEESSELRLRRNALQEQLREQAREWSRLTIAETLLEKTRQKFEEERQPGVIRHAQDFFSAVTGQRYGRLYSPIGEQSITVTDSAGASKQPGELSRGTREQLYLALRFGLIREFAEHSERLPVVVDEVLVNFDPERARLAAEAFGQLAETNQVLVFTCHPGTAEMFAEAAGAQVVDISQ